MFLMKTFKPTIGIEVHAQLKTKSKMFCGCKNNPHEDEPNTNICPVCLAHPGTLPVVNKEAIKALVMIGNAVKGEIATYSEFDRKNYFYPDIPKGYQISQYEFPFVKGGSLASVALTRIHLEEDTARSLHDQTEGSVIDFNRAGVPLMELVTEPVIHDANTAKTFARELQLLLKTLKISDANMEKGEMRVEANISISDDDCLGTKVEVKNLNSFKAVESAIEYEIKRQGKLLTANEKIMQETRGWNENTEKTFSQRVKESADDYRYFPDPDIPKIDLSKIDEFANSRIEEIMPILAAEKRSKYRDLGLQDSQVEMIILDESLDSFFTKVLQSEIFTQNLSKSIANYLTSDIVKILHDNPKKDLSTADIGHFLTLMRMLEEGKINSRIAKDLLNEVLFDDVDPETVVRERNLLQNVSEDALLPIVDQVLKENATVADEYRSGKEAALKFLVGQAMKLTRGSADPVLLQKLLEKESKSSS